MSYPPGFPPKANPITTMDPDLRAALFALKECTADTAATQADVVRYTDAALAVFDRIEAQRAKELAPRCQLASTATKGFYYCSRDPGHDGPCAAHPTLTPAELGAAFPNAEGPSLDDRVTALEQYLQQNNGVTPWRSGRNY